MNVMTFTNTPNSMIAFEDIEGAEKTLLSGGLVLFPTDTIWTVGCDLDHPEACRKLFLLKSKSSPYSIEILVHSLDMFKRYVPALHPKLETLLFYHKRPLSVVLNQDHHFPSHIFTSDQAIAVRLVRDEFSRLLIEKAGRPLLSTYATTNDDIIPSSFGGVSSSILEKMNFVAKYRQTERMMGRPAVVVTLSPRDEMIFLKE